MIDGNEADAIKKENKGNIASFLALKNIVVRSCSPHSCKEQQWTSDTHISINLICFDNLNLYLLLMQLCWATKLGYITIWEKNNLDAHVIKSKVNHHYSDQMSDQMSLISLSTVRNAAVCDFQCGMHKRSQWSTTGWAFWCGNYCRESSRFTAEVRNSFSRDHGWRVSRENVIHSCSGHNMTLRGNRRCESNHINLRCWLNCFLLSSVKFLMTMQTFSKETRKKHEDSCDQLSVITFHLKLIN